VGRGAGGGFRRWRWLAGGADRHSGKRREETASILAEHLAPAEGVLPNPGLAPKDDVRPMAETLSPSLSPQGLP
jgi:hypothetical protein